MNLIFFPSVFAMLCSIAVFLFGFYLVFKGKNFTWRAIGYWLIVISIAFSIASYRFVSHISEYRPIGTMEMPR